MASSKTYVSVAPLTMVRLVDGGYRNVYEGEPIAGEAVLPEDLKRLIRKGFLVEGEAATEQAEEGATPARSARKSDWVAFATHDDRGPDKLSVEDAEKLNRDDLAERFLGPKGD